MIDIDKGFYHEARKKGVPPLTYLTQQSDVDEERIAALRERVLARYHQPDDDSSRCRVLSQFAYDTAGLEWELAQRGHVLRGRACQTVEKTFFSSSPDTALFPAFMANQVIAGILAASLVPFFVAAELDIGAHVAEKVTMSETASDRTLKWVGEGADLPKTRVATTEGSIRLYKYGRLLEGTYEAVRLLRLDVFGLMLQRMGRQIGIDQTDDMIETLIAGDGNSGTAVVDTDAEVSGTLDYDELLRLRLAFPIGYEMQHAIVNDTNLRTILNMAEFKDPLAGFNFQRTGQFMEALGSTWHRWTSTGSASFSTDRILGSDARAAVLLYREGDLLEESDQIIERQIHQRTMSEWVGFMKWDNSATQCLDITT